MGVLTLEMGRCDQNSYIEFEFDTCNCDVWIC